MSDLAISVESLSKAYRIGLKEQEHETLLGAVTGWFKSPFQNFRDVRNLSRFEGVTGKGNGQAAEASAKGAAPRTSLSQPSDVFWALNDVSFKVKHGEAVGIIGRNGAGKSTLLKILSRITEPTNGRAVVYGRVGSLLEVGTGFHPDLTGRENVYLNGTILGMRKHEIDEKFDEIIDFSGVEQFIDTPVKRYSSGMRVRLAFSVAAHLEPEILIVDEVLAVGDMEFQSKCLGKMEDVSGSGRTVLFVSHNLGAVNQLCSRCVVLEHGGIAFDGDVGSGIDVYQRSGYGQRTSSAYVAPAEGRPGSAQGRILAADLQDDQGRPADCIGIGEPFQIKLRLQFFSRLARMNMGVQFHSSGGVPILNLRTDSQGLVFGPYEAGNEVEVIIKVPGLPFYPGLYQLEPWFGELDGKRIDQVPEGISLVLEGRGLYQSERLIQQGRGLVMMDCTWAETVKQASA